MSVLIKRLFCIVYLSLCEEMSDREIGKKVRISRPKVQRIKQKIKSRKMVEKVKNIVDIMIELY